MSSSAPCTWLACRDSQPTRRGWQSIDWAQQTWAPSLFSSITVVVVVVVVRAKESDSGMGVGGEDASHERARVIPFGPGPPVAVPEE